MRLEQGRTSVLAILKIETSRAVHVHKRMHAAAARCGRVLMNAALGPERRPQYTV